MKFRDRVKELRRVPVGDLQPHPKNWRTHPRFQQEVWRGVLREVGMADALLARELPDGTLQLVDGHLRASVSPEAILPVLIVDLDDAEAEKVLLTHDSVGALADTDQNRLADLLAEAEAETRAVGELLGKLGREITDVSLLPDRQEVEIRPSYSLVIEVADESEQESLYKRLTAEGHRCRVLTL